MTRPSQQILFHYKHVHNALAAVIKKQRKEVEKVQEAGSKVADYSLGFINALIFVHHRLSGHNDEPVFYQHETTSIGIVPKPMRLDTERDEEEAEMGEYCAHLENVVDAVKDEQTKFHGNLPEPVSSALGALEAWLLKKEEVANGSQNETPAPQLGLVAQSDEGPTQQCLPLEAPVGQESGSPGLRSSDGQPQEGEVR